MKRDSPPSSSRAAVGVLPRDDVVGEAGDDVDVDRRHGPRSTGEPSTVIAPGSDHRVVQREADEVAVQAGREPDGVLVPVEDVEGGRLLAEQVGVDDVVPHQVVRAQPREHAGQRLAGRRSRGGRIGDGRGGDLARRERRRPYRRARCRAPRPSASATRLAEPAVPARCPSSPALRMPPEQAALRCTDGAGGQLRDRVARLEDRGGVGVEVEVALLGVRVAPARWRRPGGPGATRYSTRLRPGARSST